MFPSPGHQAQEEGDAFLRLAVAGEEKLFFLPGVRRIFGQRLLANDLFVASYTFSLLPLFALISLPHTRSLD